MANIVAKIPVLAQSMLTQAKPKLAVFFKYAKVELTPPSPGDIPKAIRGFSNVLAGARNGRWKQLTVKEAWLNTLIAVEIGCWFFVGECIGRRHLVGYYIPRTGGHH